MLPVTLRTATHGRRRRHQPPDRGQPGGRPSPPAHDRRPRRRTPRASPSPQPATGSSAAPSSRRSAAGVAEVRSLVVDEAMRGQHIGSAPRRSHGGQRGGARLLDACARSRTSPPLFVRLGFTIVPHIWVPEKVALDCTSCALFRHCGQYAVMLPLRAGCQRATGAAGRRDPGQPQHRPAPAQHRAAAAPVAADARGRAGEAVPA